MMIHVKKPGFLQGKPSAWPNENPVRAITKKALMLGANQLALNDGINNSFEIKNHSPALDLRFSQNHTSQHMSHPLPKNLCLRHLVKTRNLTWRLKKMVSMLISCLLCPRHQPLTHNSALVLLVMQKRHGRMSWRSENRLELISEVGM